MRYLLVCLLAVGCGSRAMEGGGGDDDGGDDGTSHPDACPCPDSANPTTGCLGNSAGAAQPFGNHASHYADGIILPSHSQAELDDAVRTFYDYWAAKYVKQGCGAGRYYIAFDGGKSLTVSEAHGFGMVILAYMAGYDADAKTRFDGMFHYFTDHQSEITPGLMAWSQDQSCNNNMGANSATDGDLDIAFALLLADKQWSSGGDIDYRAEAGKVIDGVRAGDVDDTGGYLRLGDWTAPGDLYDATRTSDFMPDHLRSFAAATGNSVWTNLASSEYDIMDTLQTQYAPDTGLLPDFVQTPLGGPHPPSGTLLEGPNDGSYSYNACRDPWRIATDAIVNGDDRAATIAGRMNAWIRDAAGGDPQNIQAGYHLNGTGIGNYVDTSFVSPFGVAAMVGSENQAWLDAIFDTVSSTASDSGYYGDTITMLSLIVMSGNWWSPEAAPCP